MDLIRSLSSHFWVLTIFGLLNYATFSPYFSNYVALVRTRFDFSITEAGKIVSIPIMTMTLFTPLIGYASDRVNRRGFTMTFGQVLLVFSHFYMAGIAVKQVEAYPIISICANAFGYLTFVANIFASVAAVCSKNNIGFAFGLYTSFQNVAYAFSPPLIGWIIDSTK